MVVQEGHIHSAVPFIIPEAILCTEHVFDAIKSLQIPNILKFPKFQVLDGHRPLHLGSWVVFAYSYCVPY